MKNTLSAALSLIRRGAGFLWRNLRNNVGWKILSVIIALLLWSYIISSDSSITQIKTLANVEVTTSGLTVLQSRDLALLTDVSQLGDIHVRVEARQSNYARVTNDTVRVELDLSQVTKAGVQEIELTGVTAYGEVLQVMPSSVEVVIETLATRYVPVNADLSGDLSDDYWYNISRVNPTQVTVSGPSSIVRSVVAAQALMNPTDMTSSYSRSVTLALLDNEGNEITSTLARPSITEATVYLDIYPKLQLPVNANIDTAVTGTLPEGYQIKGIEVSPDTISVAADPSLLSELDALTFEPVDVTGRTSSFTTVAAVNKIKDMRYLSSEQVTVTVYIEEAETHMTMTDMPITVRGLSADLTARLSSDIATVRITGPYTAVIGLTAENVQAFVDVSGMTAGEYTLPLVLNADSAAELTLEGEPASVTVTLTGTATE